MKKYIESSSLPSDPFDYIAISSDEYIKEWQDDYEEPDCGWDNLFDNVLAEFELFCEDEASINDDGLTIMQRYENGDISNVGMELEFENWVMWEDLDDYDY